MTAIDDVVKEAVAGCPDLPAYDPDEQYVEPFACETANYANYFMQMDLPNEFAKAELRGDFAEFLAETAWQVIEKVDDVQWSSVEVVNHHMMIGTMQMLMQRWGKGGYAEGRFVKVDERSVHVAPLDVIEKKTGVRYKSMHEADKNGAIDLVMDDESLIQIKSTKKPPNFKESKHYDELWWFNNETHEFERITA